MIRQLKVKRFKRFEEVEVTLPGNMVLAGPNNCGKTTLLQALASFSFALNQWQTYLSERDRLNKTVQRHKGEYAKVPIARHAFSAVPLGTYELLWHDRKYRGAIEITVKSEDGRELCMELSSDTSEQIYVRPARSVTPETIRGFSLPITFIPPMTGLTTEEPLYQLPKIKQVLGAGRPGEVLRNLLVLAHQSEVAWNRLGESIQKLFGFEMLAPDGTGAHIRAEYRGGEGKAPLDIGSAGSGFQQVLMLLALLHTSDGSVLLVDEPDAHLHVILQDAIFSELRAVAAQRKSQLIIATHSEVIIDAVELRELCVVLGAPRQLVDNAEKARLIRSLKVLTNTDIMLAREQKGVLYVEGYTDLELLRAFAKLVEHPAQELLTTGVMCKWTVSETRPGAKGIQSRDHFDALRLVRSDIRGAEVLDGDSKSKAGQSETTSEGLVVLRWERYEIESYLIHPAALRRFVSERLGSEREKYSRAVDEYIESNYPPKFLEDPFEDIPMLRNTKARTDLLPQILAAGGLAGLEYQQWFEIALQMNMDEVHPEVRDKLDRLVEVFRA